MKTLRVKLVGCTGLAGKDENKSSNPYIQLLYGETEFITPIKYSSLNPVFDEEYEFEQLKHESTPLVITVWSAPHPNSKGKDKDPKFLGCVEIPSTEYAAPRQGSL